MTAFWTPLGLMKYTRLIMGAKNASAIAQAIFARYLAEDLTEEDLNRIVNFQDDYLGFSNEWAELLRTLEAFFQMCRKRKIRINPAKMHIGESQAKFYGYVISQKGLEPAESNLDPIRKLTSPTNRSEVRSLLGLFVQFRRFFPRYDRLAEPIQLLLRKDRKFEWGEEQQKSLDKMKKHISQPGIYLAAANKKEQLVLETDGSDDGWGAILLQIINGERRVIAMWSGRWKTVAMRKAPPYYKETKAWMLGLDKARVYADAHPMPIKCVTDHIPLTWIKNTSGKGPVSQFILDNLSYLDYEITYRPGSQLVEADAVSRYPCLGPKIMTDEGKLAALKTLFKSLPKQWKIKGRTWINTGKDSKLARELMAAYQAESATGGRVPLTDNPSPSKIAKQEYDFAVFTPYADTATKVLDAALTKNAPFACLMPISLVGRAPEGQENRDKLQAAIKIVLLDPEMVWILHKVPGIGTHQVQAREIHRMAIEPEGIIAKHPELDLQAWPEQQLTYLRKHPAVYKGQIYRNEANGLYFYVQADKTERKYSTGLKARQEPSAIITKPFFPAQTGKLKRNKKITDATSNRGAVTDVTRKGEQRLKNRTGAVTNAPAVTTGLPKGDLKLIVPEAWHVRLSEWQHRAMLHAGAAKVLAKLAKKYHWATMRKDVAEACKNCGTCALLNAKRLHAHKHFRAKVFEGPRTAWAFDYHGVAASEDGYKEILGGIDMATAEIRLFATKSRTAAVTTDCLLQGIILRDGVPLVIHSDHAKEFISKTIKTLAKTFGITATTTLAHHPTGNSKIERLWQYVAKCLCNLNPKQHQH